MYIFFAFCVVASAYKNSALAYCVEYGRFISAVCMCVSLKCGNVKWIETYIYIRFAGKHLVGHFFNHLKYFLLIFCRLYNVYG